MDILKDFTTEKKGNLTTYFKGAHVITDHHFNDKNVLTFCYLGKSFFQDGFVEFINPENKIDLIRQYISQKPFEQIVKKIKDSPVTECNHIWGKIIGMFDGMTPITTELKCVLCGKYKKP